MIAAVVPAKALDAAKTRLAALLSEDDRRRLSLAMLQDVVRALQGEPRIEAVNVVSPDDDVLRVAAGLGAVALPEPASVRGLNQSLSHALSAISPRPDGLLVVLADVPGLTPADVSRVLHAAPERGVVICPSSARGTSALFLRPPDAIAFRFGERSFQAHKREAAARGLPHKVLRIDSLENDIDEPDDLRRLHERPAETATHRLLAQLGVAERLSWVAAQ